MGVGWCVRACGGTVAPVLNLTAHKCVFCLRPWWCGFKHRVQAVLSPDTEDSLTVCVARGRGLVAAGRKVRRA